MPSNKPSNSLQSSLHIDLQPRLQTTPSISRHTAFRQRSTRSLNKPSNNLQTAFKTAFFNKPSSRRLGCLQTAFKQPSKSRQTIPKQPSNSLQTNTLRKASNKFRTGFLTSFQKSFKQLSNKQSNWPSNLPRNLQRELSNKPSNLPSNNVQPAYMGRGTWAAGHGARSVGSGVSGKSNGGGRKNVGTETTVG